jgi:uncharacterized protein YaaN involved in tellurite resistance
MGDIADAVDELESKISMLEDLVEKQDKRIYKLEYVINLFRSGFSNLAIKEYDISQSETQNDGKPYCYISDNNKKYFQHWTNGEGNEPISRCLTCKYCEYNNIIK